MQYILIPLVIIGVIIGGFIYFEQLQKTEDIFENEKITEEKLKPSEETLYQNQKNTSYLSPSEPDITPSESEPETIEKPKGLISEGIKVLPSEARQVLILIDTKIISGPKEGEIFNETNEVSFEFEADISPKETEGNVVFETKFEGFDSDWILTSSNKRKAKLPGSKEYTFLVRAKIKDSIDQTPAKRTFKINVSPYFEKVKISGTRLKTSSYPALITLSTFLKKEEEINITNWSIRGNKGSFTIPQGIERYRHIYGPSFKEDIFVKYGDKVYLSGAAGPLGRNINFRPNKCMGYLSNYHYFPIPISKNCHRPTKEEISYLELCCQQFINSLSRCEAPDYSQKLSVLFDTECIAYINNNLNYEGCFKKYSKAEGFLEKSWHIYMDTDFIRKECDTLYLRDQNGLLVHKYLYGQLYCN